MCPNPPPRPQGCGRKVSGKCARPRSGRPAVRGAGAKGAAGGPLPSVPWIVTTVVKVLESSATVGRSDCPQNPASRTHRLLQDGQRGERARRGHGRRRRRQGQQWWVFGGGQQQAATSRWPLRWRDCSSPVRPIRGTACAQLSPTCSRQAAPAARGQPGQRRPRPTPTLGHRPTPACSPCSPPALASTWLIVCAGASGVGPALFGGCQGR